MPRQLVPFLAVLAATLAPAYAAVPEGDEAVFSDAAAWTVIVRTSVEMAFIEDDQGSGLGAGFVVDAKRGWIVTNAHVSSHSPARISVTFRSDKPIKAEQLYVDSWLDLAVLQVDPRQLPVNAPQAPLACEGFPPIGHPVGAFGHPWRYYFTGTRGITSARSARFGPDMIQTDASINSGNSGGPLISLKNGMVIGVNTAIAVGEDKKRAEGIGFAVPMTQICPVLELLHAGKDPSPPERLLHYARPLGEESSLTIADSALSAGGLTLNRGDTIVAANGHTVTSEGELVAALRGHLDAVRLTIERGGKNLELTGRWPAAQNPLERQGLVIGGALFAATPTTFTHALKAPPALMVHDLIRGSEAEAADLAHFDLVVDVDGEPVTSLAQLEKFARRASESGKELRLLLARQGEGEAWLDYQERYLTPEDIQKFGATDTKARLTSR
jgi:S1-C subfamily serine protease